MKFSKAFICANHEIEDFGKEVPAPTFRKKFILNDVAKRAEITICGLGFYELYVNGKDVTRGKLSSYISNPDQVCYYDSYDVAPYLKKGENVVGVLLGNGFRNPFGGFIWEFDKADFRGPVTFALSFESDELDFESDTDFKTKPSAILWNDIRMGYCYDARLELEGWEKPGFDDSDWDNAVVCEKPPKGEPKICEAPPVAEKDWIKPISVTFHEKIHFGHAAAAIDSRPLEQTLRRDVYLFDFGQNFSGVTRLHIKNARSGQKITIRHGELMLDGKEFTITNTIFPFRRDGIEDRYLEYAQRDVFVCKGGDEVFVPKFKYDGFRYAFVEGLSPDQIDDDTLIFITEHSDVAERSGFKSSDETLDKLFVMTRKSLLSNMVHIPTDCPHREKNGWTGDASLSAELFLLSTDSVSFLKEWLYTFFKAQTKDGDFPAIVPTGTWGYGDPYAGPIWDAVCVTLPYALYKYAGDKAPIREYAPYLMKYFDYLETKKDERGLFVHGLGDWVEPFRCYRDGFETASPTVVTSSIAVYDMLNKASFLFDAVGLNAESKETAKRAKELRTRIRKNLIDFRDYIVDGDCQTSQVFAIAAGIFEKSEEKKAKHALRRMIKHDNMLACGIIGRRYIFDVLADMGEIDTAYSLIVSRNVTSYGIWIDEGNTTLCESFAPRGAVLDSRNHHFLGDISRWMVERVAGLRINPTMADPNSFVVAPDFPTNLNFAEAYFDFADGRVSVSWKREENQIKLVVSVPKGHFGSLVLPKGYRSDKKEKVLSDGENIFAIVRK